MQEQLQSATRFFKEDFGAILGKLSPEAKPQWGLMTPQHMVEHLIVTFKMSIGRINIPVISKEEDFPRLKAYLMKDSPMRRSVPSPTGNNDLQTLRAADLHQAIDKLKGEAVHYIQFMSDQPEFVANHPYGGPMKPDEWLLFHRKHCKHHFIQFGLIPDYG